MKMAQLNCLLFGGEPRSLQSLKLLYLTHFAAFASLTYLPVYFETKEHYTKFQIGILQTLPCICSFIAPPLWGAISDLIQNQRAVHIFCLISGALLTFSIRFIDSFGLMCIVMFFSNFQSQPTYSLLDQIAMKLISREGGDYGKQRLYGAIGWGIGGYLTAFFVSIGGIAFSFNLLLFLSIFSIILRIWYLPEIKDDFIQTSHSHVHIKEDFLKSIQSIFHQFDVLVLFILVFVQGIVIGVINNFLMLYLFNLSDQNTNIVGLLIVVETVSELPLFFYAEQILKQFGTFLCIMIGLFGFFIRLSFYSFGTNAWMAFPFELLHGVTFGLLWSAFTKYLYQAAPKGTEGTMIGMLLGVQNGLGSGVGTLIGGWLYEIYGGHFMWRIILLSIPIAMLIAVFFSYLSHEYVPKKNKQIVLVVNGNNTEYASISLLEKEQPLKEYGTN